DLESSKTAKESFVPFFKALGVILLAVHLCPAAGGDDKALTPVEARKKIGQNITVEMTVRAAKDRLSKRGEIYLDAETNFRDEKNFAVIITKAGAESLKKAGVDSPADHFKDKKIRATGTVKEVDKVPRIDIDEAKNIKVIQE
ncbi:MAG TPA: hypothetical protein VGY58_10785, partial [Gemmataceae bacterium]|nr:hypothetical protein [Gemmataceae bacterium]